MDAFLLNYFQCVLELNKLLGMRFVWDGNTYVSPGLRTPIGKSVARVMLYHNKGDFDNRNVEIGILCLLARHLQMIQEYDTGLLKQFRRRIHAILKWEDYFGWRMEVNIAASLIKKSISFTKGESPDFTIPSEGVHIECGSIHLSRHKQTDALKKLALSILGKSRKPYCNTATALFLDFTNVFHAMESGSMRRKESDELKSFVTSIFAQSRSDFGSVLLFGYWLSSSYVIHSSYLRTDNPLIDRRLLVFLNSHYPLGKHWTGPQWLPEQG